MNKNYLTSLENLNKYSNRKTYYKSLELSNVATSRRDYQLLPEEYDVFSKIDISIIQNQESEQFELFESFRYILKKKLLEIFRQFGVLRILPKLNLIIDQDEAIVLEWGYVNYRIYLNFEKNVKESFYGIIVVDAETGTSSESGKIQKNNLEDIVNKILIFLFSYS